MASDPRVIKESRSLARNGYGVLILAWDRELDYPTVETTNGTVIKRLKLKAPYGSPALILYIPIFWIWAFIELVAYHPKVAHACDLDTVIPAYMYKLIFRGTKLVFDIVDNYALAFIDPRRRTLCSLVNFLEDALASKADVVFTVSEERLKPLTRAKSKPAMILMNCPMPLETRASRIKTSGKFRIVYAGPIGKGCGLIEIAKVTKGFPDIEFIIAGRIIDGNVLNALLKYPQVEYVGLLPYDEALSLEATADVIPILYDPEIPINRVASPNKLFEAMMFGVSVVTNVVESVVNEVGCGTLVNYNDMVGIKRALSYLKDHPEIRREMGLRGQKAFKEKYNWLMMERKLLDTYAKLVRQ